ncbi:DUF1652 domain-containing protein [Pseudomonas sp. Fig-3]|uniref:DUF1652 domain-containing protein n=1 Tax=unclassified Pseudomonas TaxID=196821 RepID=UPI0010DAC865|nr:MULTISPECIES: DUF1652 domain-containing protein [unclassified Pseudomonas]TNB81536.1 DUF1652 domain-containing protein [Pseudomonas sp. Fig-3]VII91665.1 hypothetical protein [Pseudomonas sp. FG-3G]
MISSLELRHIIECGFQPLSCTCTANPDGSLMIKVFDSTSGRVDLLVTAVTTSQLTSSRAIVNLIGELRSEMAAHQAMGTVVLGDSTGLNR